MVLLTGGCTHELEHAPQPQPQSATETPGPTTTPTPSVDATAEVAPASPAPSEATPSPDDGGAAAQLRTLRVAGRAPMTGYDRARFGQAWLDADRNGCDTRNDVLRRDLDPFSLDPATGGCVVLRGVLADPYTSARIDFVRGDGTLVDIDHVVALGNAWASGAWQLDVRTRAAFANDPLNLLAADAGTNRSKGDANAVSWLPPSKGFRCGYVARQVAVKSRYDLAVTPSEQAAIARQLDRCPGQPATPDVDRAPTRVDQDVTDPGRAPSPSPAPAAGAAVYFENCDAARAAGAAPVRRGDAGYGPHLDRDGDGSACE